MEAVALESMFADFRSAVDHIKQKSLMDIEINKIALEKAINTWEFGANGSHQHQEDADQSVQSRDEVSESTFTTEDLRNKHCKHILAANVTQSRRRKQESEQREAVEEEEEEAEADQLPPSVVSIKSGEGIEITNSQALATVGRDQPTESTPEDSFDQKAASKHVDSSGPEPNDMPTKEEGKPVESKQSEVESAPSIEAIAAPDAVPDNVPALELTAEASEGVEITASLIELSNENQQINEPSEQPSASAAMVTLNEVKSCEGFELTASTVEKGLGPQETDTSGTSSSNTQSFLQRAFSGLSGKKSQSSDHVDDCPSAPELDESVVEKAVTANMSSEGIEITSSMAAEVVPITLPKEDMIVNGEDDNHAHGDIPDTQSTASSKKRRSLLNRVFSKEGSIKKSPSNGTMKSTTSSQSSIKKVLSNLSLKKSLSNMSLKKKKSSASNDNSDTAQSNLLPPSEATTLDNAANVESNEEVGPDAVGAAAAQEAQPVGSYVADEGNDVKADDVVADETISTPVAHTTKEELNTKTVSSTSNAEVVPDQAVCVVEEVEMLENIVDECRIILSADAMEEVGMEGQQQEECLSSHNLQTVVSKEESIASAKSMGSNVLNQLDAHIEILQVKSTETNASSVATNKVNLTRLEELKKYRSLVQASLAALNGVSDE